MYGNVVSLQIGLIEFSITFKLAIQEDLPMVTTLHPPQSGLVSSSSFWGQATSEATNKHFIKPGFH